MRELRVNKVLSVAPPAAGAGGHVATDRSGTLLVTRQELVGALGEIAANGELVSLEYDVATRELTAVGSAPPPTSS